jgi:hypothetical protein
VLLAVLSYARDLGYPVGHFKVKRLPVRGQGRVHAWTAEELTAPYNAFVEKSPELLPIVVFLANTGCRRGEAMALEWQNVDLERRIIRILPSGEWRPKNNRPHEVPINDALLPWLEGKPQSERWGFPTRTETRYVHWPQLQFDRARKHAGLKGGPHTLRQLLRDALPRLDPGPLPAREDPRPLAHEGDRDVRAPLARPPGARARRREPRAAGHPGELRDGGAVGAPRARDARPSRGGSGRGHGRADKPRTHAPLRRSLKTLSATLSGEPAKPGEELLTLRLSWSGRRDLNSYGHLGASRACTRSFPLRRRW